MKLRFLFVGILFLKCTLFFTQTDSVLVPAGLNVVDAIYLTYGDFRYNNGIIKEQIVADGNKEQLDFIGKTLETNKLTYSFGANTVTISPKQVWGFIQNKTLYINYAGDFYRVPVFGSVSHLVATVEVVSVGMYDPMFGAGMGTSTRRKELREFLINYYDGIAREFKLSDAEDLISRDAIVYTEYKKLSRHQQKEQIFRYIRKYNEAHPVYFLK